MRRKKIVVIGGGTGTYTALVGLKKYPVDLSVIITMTDSGGSNRVIRDEFGLLPTSDIRQCMVALASEKKATEVLRKLFTYRYSQGKGISGMTFGNLFMAALTDIYGSQEKAIDATCEVLRVQGQIIPVSYDNVNLVARYENKEEVIGEHFIDEPSTKNAGSRIAELGVFPKAKANPRAIKAIKEADVVVLGPGDLYTSILCNLVIDGISEAIVKSKAKKVYVLNLMTRYGQTTGFSAKDHLREAEKYLGKNAIDVILVNDSNGFPKGVLERYAEENAFPVKDDLNGSDKVKVIRETFISGNVFEKAKGDSLVRSLIRHDSDKLAKAIISLL